MSDALAAASVRTAAAGDGPAISALLVEAFDGPAEARLVERLRRADDFALELVATAPGGEIIGHVAFPRLAIHDGSGVRPALALAPLAVAVAWRRRGIGAALVRAGLDLLSARGEEIVFVLGDEAYYGRFGFDAGEAATFASPYAGPHFQAKRLSAAAPSRGTIRYPAAFDELG